MKTRTAILIAIAALLLLGSVALAQPDNRTPGRWFCVEPASAAAQGYRLTSVTWRVSGTACGGGYRLLEAPALTGSGCCCTYLPLIRR